ncbi:hypothetical protein KC343_g14503 [Hortaea werneckii]|nr:hypothetical protein KC323_g6245 [Hortaea werneckii]KAI7173707.1 hypothetical protein KC352_g24550 [Hortaea werneckii]KAI7556055.1 hypothetical protein KC317_g12523 [Hortaea werneckii]KAI7598403.1 hypothetical protein KC346_g14244 [Hortaea werneckii]KAI7603492.1 hypothetical protein KC343_g14503 [Hortaea werneckii]
MSKLIVVCGATGQLGGSVARRMLNGEGWRVRAITRNVNSQAAQALAAKGAELASADYDDEASLVEVFKDANAIFAVTNFWDYLMQLGQAGAGEKEFNQMLTIARAAQKSSTLEHFIIHTLASGEKLAGKDYICPHWDYKDKAADEIKRSLPDLAKKTTFLGVGFFVSNLFSMLKPLEMPGTYGGHIVVLPCKPETIMWVTDVEHNVGCMVHAVLSNPSRTLPAKYVSVHSDILPLSEVFKTWSKVTGKRVELVQCTPENYEGIMLIFGKELASQVKLNEVATDWYAAYDEDDKVMPEDLGVQDRLLSLKQSLEANKDKL